jgi:FSR family fosmidomycin resistance protein-like MFS transporter
MGESTVPKANFIIISFIGLSHFVNDLVQGVIPSIYPLLKEKYQFSFVQIGLITFAFQFSASILQPLVGYYMDRRPKINAIIFGFTFSTLGMLFLTIADHFNIIIVSVILIGIGSAIFHPEGSRIANIASAGKIGTAQSIFQIGGNLGTATAPLLVAFIVLPNNQELIITFILPLFVGFLLLRKIAKWYKGYLKQSLSRKSVNSTLSFHYSKKKLKFIFGILLIIIFSKFIYAASLSSYYSFYLIEKFNLTIKQAQFHLSIYLFSYMLGTIIGGPLGDKFGRLYVIWFSVIGAVPFILTLPYVSLLLTDIFMILIGFIMASAFPAILSYAQELVPKKLGMISGMFYGFAFGIAAIGAALIGILADNTSMEFVYKVCSFLPLLGIVCLLLPKLQTNTLLKATIQYNNPKN